MLTLVQSLRDVQHEPPLPLSAQDILLQLGCVYELLGEVSDFTTSLLSEVQWYTAIV